MADEDDDDDGAAATATRQRHFSFVSRRWWRLKEGLLAA